MGRVRTWFSVDKAKDMLSAKPYQQQYLAKACSGRWQHLFFNHRWVCFACIVKISNGCHYNIIILIYHFPCRFSKKIICLLGCFLVNLLYLKNKKPGLCWYQSHFRHILGHCRESGVSFSKLPKTFLAQNHTVCSLAKAKYLILCYFMRLIGLVCSKNCHRLIQMDFTWNVFRNFEKHTWVCSSSSSSSSSSMSYQWFTPC